MTMFDHSVEKLPREQLRALQFQKLQEVLRLVFGRNKFYTKKWREAGLGPHDIQSLTDLRKLPFTFKSELMHAQEEAPPTRACIRLRGPRALRCAW